MALERGKFGIEYNPRQMRDDSSGLGWVLVAVALAALVSLTWTLVKRFRTAEDPALAEETVVEEAPSAPADPPPEAVAPPEPVRQGPVSRTDYTKRPTKVRNLLLRLEEAERRRDVEMAVTTIEAIRALPGSPAADIDDALARRLGTLNLRRLFVKRNAQWVKQVAVKRGDAATRIAAENGSTFASFVRLNGGDVNRLSVGAKVYVMDHPRFNLVIHRRTRSADLSLNGKFFKRYDLQAEVKAKEGAYEMPEKKKSFWVRIGARFKPEEQIELETLMPVGASVLVSEM